MVRVADVLISPRFDPHQTFSQDARQRMFSQSQLARQQRFLAEAVQVGHAVRALLFGVCEKCIRTCTSVCGVCVCWGESSFFLCRVFSSCLGVVRIQCSFDAVNDALFYLAG